MSDAVVGRAPIPSPKKYMFEDFMTNKAKNLLTNISELAPHISSRAAEIEAGRRMPPDLVEALRSIGVFRMFVPQSHGGLELDLPAALEIIATLAESTVRLVGPR